MSNTFDILNKFNLIKLVFENGTWINNSNKPKISCNNKAVD